MAWGKADDYLSEVFSKNKNLEKMAKEKKLKSESRLDFESLKEFVYTVNSILMSVDDYLLENYTRGILIRDFVSVGVGPYGELGVIYEGYALEGDLLFIPLDGDYFLYSSGISGDNKLESVKNTPVNLSKIIESMFSGGGTFLNRAFRVHNGLIDIYSNGLLSDVIYTFSIKTGRLV